MKRLISLLMISLCLSGCGVKQEQNVSEEQIPNITVATQRVIHIARQVIEVESQQFASLFPLEGKTICVDPGHEVTNLRIQEPISPYSSETKEAFAGGASGRNQTEEQLTLSIGFKLRSLLEKQGAIVIMTRTTHESDMTSYKRAQLANEKNVDLCIRIHADGSTDSSVYGMSMLVPYGEQLAAQDIVEPSLDAGKYVLEATVARTGAKNNGIVQRTDLTGFNFAEVPTILIEMGFMSNPDEDALMETEAYQQKLAQGMCDGIVQYFARA